MNKFFAIVIAMAICLSLCSCSVMQEQKGAGTASTPDLAELESAIEPLRDTGGTTPNKKIDSEIIENELLRLINSLRDEVGVITLGIEEDMRFAARIRAEDALASFSHTRPNGSPYSTAFDDAGFSYEGKWHGENLSSLKFTPGMFNEKEIAFEMFMGLKKSPGHYRNMVSENFVQAGVGVVIRYNAKTVDVASAQMFSSL